MEDKPYDSDGPAAYVFDWKAEAKEEYRVELIIMPYLPHNYHIQISRPIRATSSTK